MFPGIEPDEAGRSLQTPLGNRLPVKLVQSIQAFGQSRSLPIRHAGVYSKFEVEKKIDVRSEFDESDPAEEFDQPPCKVLKEARREMPHQQGMLAIGPENTAYERSVTVAPP
jgi:hypothetical protein